MHTGCEFVITAASSGTWEFVDKFQKADDVAYTPPISVTAEVNTNQNGKMIYLVICLANEHSWRVAALWLHHDPRVFIAAGLNDD